ncbi:unnamed protein product [Rotaria magnacalcarata]|uniref:F-box domain-containing protein n=1 Tax=Rotaria magnacalcarata TaxID=392030 RepID=A0A816SFW0_9BILA|nr:unnamed protein product [Rotaria magnacalcarata]CAF2087788.1 unnamed protein product [Rotaria magnacalcarata]CAF3861798.1 unnamed protein product [Rotaria magnacalcarata]CAF4067080.1 unnamed protein product [Rotaria magnacalcarata]
MEYLPDELLLLSFRYLHRFDLLYTFKDLNRRFQQIVEPYLYKVNLTQANLSYKHFRLFVKHILPSHGNSIRSLTVSGLQLFDLVRLHLHHLPSLESITLKRPLIDTVRSDKLEKFLIQVLRIPTLKHLSIDYHGGIIFELISQYATPNLQTLKVLHSYDFYYFGYVTQQSPYLKRLSINLMSTIDLVKLFQVAVNLNQLNLSFYTFADLEVREVPDTLEKLHLEIDFRLLKSKNNKKSLHQSNFHMLSKLLNNFRNNLKYLDLIVLNAEKEFSDFDKFHSLVNSFDQLETFEYDIRTKYRPDQRFPNVDELISANSTYSIYTNPRPQPFDTSFKRVEFEKTKLNSDLTRSQLLVATSLDVTDGDFFDVNLPSSFELSDDLKLVNLNKIHICKSTIDSNPEIRPFLSKVIALASNLHTLVLESDIEHTLLLLKQFITSANISRKIAEVQLIQQNFFDDQDLAFFSNIAHIVPNLKSLSLTLHKEFSVRNSDIKKLIRRTRAGFRKLNNLTLKLFDDDVHSDDRDMLDSALESYKKSLNELRHETGESLYWSTDYNMSGAFIIIWM